MFFILEVFGYSWVPVSAIFSLRLSSSDKRRQESLGDNKVELEELQHALQFSHRVIQLMREGPAICPDERRENIQHT